MKTERENCATILFSRLRKGQAFKIAFVFIALLLTNISPMSAALKGDKFVIDGVSYQVIDETNMYVCALGIDYSNTKSEVDIPQTVTNKDEKFTVTQFGGSWEENYQVKVIKLPSTVTTINSMAISGNNSLTDFYIPSSVTTINKDFGSVATHFPKFHVEGSNFYADANGVLYSADKTVLYAVPSSATVTDGKYTFPDGVKSILSEVIAGMSGLTTIGIPASLEYIASGAFTNSNNNIAAVNVDVGNTHFSVADNGALIKLNASGNGADTLVYYPKNHAGETFTVPDNVTVLLPNCIAYNSNVTTVNLNKTITTATGALTSLHNLTTLGISASVTKLDGFTSDCPKISAYNIDEGNTVYESKDGIVFTKDGKTLVLYPPARPDTVYTVPEGTTTIPENTFNNCPLHKLTIASTVTSLTGGSIANMPNLTELDFAPNSQITSLWWQMIMSLPKLKKIILPASVTEMDERAIRDCQSLEEIVVPDGSKLKTLNSGCLSGTPALKHFTFEGSSVLTTIGNEVFSGMTSLESFTIPATVTSIGRSAFKGCTNLKKLTFAKGSQIKTLGNGCFAECGFDSIALPDQIDSIGAEAFRSCTQLKTVHLSSTLRAINPTAFKWCTGITSYTVDESNPYFSSTHGMLCDKAKTTLMLFPAGLANDEATVIPPSITAIGDHAFYDCTNLTNAVIPQKVTKIGARAFGLDNSLNSITLLCDNVIAPENVETSTNTMSFDDGSLGGETTNMFNNITLYVRKDLESAYQNSSFWKKFKAIKTSFTVQHPGGSSDETDEFLPLSQKGLLLISTKSKTPVYVAPQEVVNSGDEAESSYKRNVNMIDNYAFENCDGIKEVVLKNNIYSIGALAFYTKLKSTTANGTTTYSPDATSIQDVVFCGSKAPEVMMSDYYELDKAGDYYAFSKDQKIYVKKSVVGEYKTAMAHFDSQIDYKIPGLSISNTYGTFCREFDTDLSDFYKTNKNANVAAFVAGYAHEGTDEDGNAVSLVHMTSIDENGGYTADGENTYGYIPANTGVMLKVLDAGLKATPDSFYYTIGEHDDTNYTIKDNLMTGVLTPNTTVSASETSPVYVVSKSSGKLAKMTKDITNFPVHRAYLRLPASATAKAGVRLVFDDSSVVTAIDAVNAEKKADDGKWYDLNGMVVPNPLHGVFIHNNKKVIKQ